MAVSPQRSGDLQMRTGSPRRAIRRSRRASACPCGPRSRAVPRGRRGLRRRRRPARLSFPPPRLGVLSGTRGLLLLGLPDREAEQSREDGDVSADEDDGPDDRFSHPLSPPSASLVPPAGGGPPVPSSGAGPSVPSSGDAPP